MDLKFKIQEKSVEGICIFCLGILAIGMWLFLIVDIMFFQGKEAFESFDIAGYLGFFSLIIGFFVSAMFLINTGLKTIYRSVEYDGEYLIIKKFRENDVVIKPEDLEGYNTYVEKKNGKTIKNPLYIYYNGTEIMLDQKRCENTSEIIKLLRKKSKLVFDRDIKAEPEINIDFERLVIDKDFKKPGDTIKKYLLYSKKGWNIIWIVMGVGSCFPLINMRFAASITLIFYVMITLRAVIFRDLILKNLSDKSIHSSDVVIFPWIGIVISILRFNTIFFDINVVNASATNRFIILGIIVFMVVGIAIRWFIQRKNNSTLKARIVSNILLVIIMVVTTRAMVCAQLRINESMGNAWEEQVVVVDKDSSYSRKAGRTYSIYVKDSTGEKKYFSVRRKLYRKYEVDDKAIICHSYGALGTEGESLR